MEKLGVELPLLLTQIINFSIMLVILTKLLYKPILKGLKDRRKKIEEGLAFAEKAKVEEEKLNQKKQEMLKETKEEARVILENAKKDGKRLKDELVAEGKQELEAQKERQEKEMQTKYDDMAKELQSKTVDIAAEMVKRLLGDILSDTDQHKLISKQLEKLQRKS